MKRQGENNRVFNARKRDYYMNKCYYSVVLLLFRVALVAQGTFGFEDGGLSGWIQSPPERWGTATDAALEGNYSLHHVYDNPAAGVDYIGRDIAYPDLTDTLTVTFRVRHGYNPSSSNNWQMFFLANNHAELEPGQPFSSAIIAGVNYTGSDDHVKIWQLYRGNVTEICSSGLNYQEVIGPSGTPLFRIIRYPDGRWSLGCSLSGSEDSLVHTGEGYEAESPGGKYLGFRYSYTSAQDRKLWVDGIRIGGRFSRDTVPPQVTRHGTAGLRAVEIIFSEEVIVCDSSFVWLHTHGASGAEREGIRPDSVQTAGDLCRLFFSKDFPNRREQQLRVAHVADLEGNVMADTVLLFCQELSAFGDVVITEIMTDPEPRVYLPPCEYVEIFNRYYEAIDVTGWTIRINNSAYVLNPAVILPGGYLLLTHKNCAEMYGDISLQAIIGSATALTNSGGSVLLYDQYERMIHRVEYASMDRYDSDRSDGGWSLERLDPDNLCGGFENWGVSNGWSGGTPGSENSLRTKVPDYDPPLLQYIGVPDSCSVLLTFDEPVLLHPDGEHRFTVGNATYDGGSGPLPEAQRAILLGLNEPLVRDVIYGLKISGVGDCAGNLTGLLSEQFMLPALPRTGFPLVNEIMYDPVDDGNEYFELHNPGEDFLDLHDLRFRVTPAGSMEGKLVELSMDSHLLAPGGYVVFTGNSRALREEWELDRGVGVSEPVEWRSLPNSGGTLQITGRGGEVLDICCYHDSMHHDMVGITKGVALERIHAGSCVVVSQCWTSASASVNYGTPGRENSQRIPGVQNSSGLHIFPEVFSPDNDGFEDILEISLPDGDQHTLVDIFVTGTDGVRVRDIVFRGIRGTTDSYYWDGQDDGGRIALPGIYVVHVVISAERGKKVYRKACAVKYR
jgi:hypothetical protein